MARLFVGTFLGQEEKERIALASQENIDGPVKLRWAKVEKLHVTWLFLGDVAEDLIPSVTDALSRSLVEFKQQADEQRHLQLIFDSLKIWPNERNPRHVVILASQPSKPVLLMAEIIHRHLLPFCSKENAHKERFHPHLTLARFKINADISSMEIKKLSSCVQQLVSLKELPPVVLKIESVNLIASNLDADRYAIVFAGQPSTELRQH